MLCARPCKSVFVPTAQASLARRKANWLEQAAALTTREEEINRQDEQLTQQQVGIIGNNDTLTLKA